MDRSAATVGENPDGSEAVGDRAETLNRLVRPVKPMRRLFSADGVDRRLVRGIVQAFANVKGLSYEEAHQKLTAGAEKIGFDAPDRTPDALLTYKERESRDALAVRNAKLKVLRGRFSDDDGAGFRDDDHAHERSMRGKV